MILCVFQTNCIINKQSDRSVLPKICDQSAPKDRNGYPAESQPPKDQKDGEDYEKNTDSK